MGYERRRNEAPIPSKKQLEDQIDKLNADFNKKYWMERSVVNNFWDDTKSFSNTLVDLFERSWEDGSDKIMTEGLRREYMFQYLMGLRDGLTDDKTR